MNAATTLGAFAVGLGLVFAGAAGVGNAVGPIGAVSEPDDGHGGEAHDGSGGAAPAPEGLSTSLDGYSLALDTTTLQQGEATPLSFRVLGPGGSTGTDYTPTHDRDLHLIVVRRDGTGFQHVHPTRDAAGQWTIELELPTAGAYKVFVDTAPDDREESLALTADLSVAGDYQPQPFPATTRSATVDGYTVTLAGDLVAGRTSDLVLSVARDGEPITDLEPYLAAYGHLVSLRAGDLAYVHTHPEGEPDDGSTPPGPDITFGVDTPTAGDYLLYLDFQHDGVVRTATFAVPTADSTGMETS